MIFLSGCRGQKAVEQTVDDNASLTPVSVFGASRTTANRDEVALSPSTMAMPKAVVYKTNGDYADHVFVNINGDQIVYYPAPTDVSEKSAPLPLGDGWLLDRRGGIGANSAFTTYTYAEYHALEHAPTPAQLKASIIDGARVTEVRQLPITVQQAMANPELAKSYITEE